jgi:hypothetical protein
MKRAQPKPGLKNRDISRTAKSGKFWCFGCDANLVPDGVVCSVCGRKPQKNKTWKNRKSYEATDVEDTSNESES